MVITDISLERGLLRGQARNRMTAILNPVFSWKIACTEQNALQTWFRIKVTGSGKVLWDSGKITGAQQEIRYNGPALPGGVRLTVSVTAGDNHGHEAPVKSEYFYHALVYGWDPVWVAPADDFGDRAVYLRKEFTLNKKVKDAALYSCGLGYQILSINGHMITPARLDPPHSDYSKTCYYVLTPELAKYLKKGKNLLGLCLGQGWRRNQGKYADSIKHENPIFGIVQATYLLVVTYDDGTTERFGADGAENCLTGPIVHNHLFDGETYDAGQDNAGWDKPDYKGFLQPVKIVPSPGGAMRPGTLEPITEKGEFAPLTISQLDACSSIVDFGQNIAGVVRLKIPKMKKSESIIIRHMEFLDEDGRLYLPNLRGAKCTDIYIAGGDNRDLDFFQPSFTYHGFRYVQIEGYPDALTKDDITAIRLYSDVDSTSFFTCGNALINKIHRNVVETERDNIHGILTDCPQRDERMGWMNDATVRFEETPYNFRISRLFAKVTQDLIDCQSDDGAITCTAPYLYGSRPADPVCSSYLIIALELLLFYNDQDTLAKAYPGYKAWEACLGANADNYIVNYSYYGDWAGPAGCCVGEDGARSAVTPGIFMSTGYYYYNAVLLARFANLLGKNDEAEEYCALASSIKSAMLDKWLDGENAVMATGSQACQAFSLWLGLFPEEMADKAAAVMRNDLVARDYAVTTGNLCSRYLVDMLFEYGYQDDAYALLTREEYPSFGYMIQNEATTIWERYELKKSSGMNSHNHPMYGAVGYCFYAYLTGIKLRDARHAVIKPYMPKKLLSAQASVETCMGDITVRWVKQYGNVQLHVGVPFGMTATIYIAGEQVERGSGFWRFTWPLNG